MTRLLLLVRGYPASLKRECGEANPVNWHSTEVIIGKSAKPIEDLLDSLRE